MSGFLGVDQLGASVITLNFQGIIYLVSLGGSISTSSIIGNSLGASNPENAKKYTNMGIILSLILSVITTFIFGLFGNQMISIFTDHIEIKSIAEKMIPLLLIILWGDYISLICGGMITAMGYQSNAIIHSIICFWVLIIPLGYIFGIIFDMGVHSAHSPTSILSHCTRNLDGSSVWSSIYINSISMANILIKLRRIIQKYSWTNTQGKGKYEDAESCCQSINQSFNFHCFQIYLR